MGKTMPIFEPLPYYMSALCMASVRFIEGNDGTGAGGGEPKPSEGSETGKPADHAPKPAEGEEPGENDGTTLESERKRADDAESLASGRAAELETKNQEIATLATTVSERDTTIKAKDREIWLLKAVIQHPVPKEKHHLLIGDDEATILANAKLLSEPSTGSGVIPESGTGGGSSNPSGGSVAAGRDMYASDRPKKAGA